MDIFTICWDFHDPAFKDKVDFLDNKLISLLAMLNEKIDATLASAASKFSVKIRDKGKHQAIYHLPVPAPKKPTT